MAAEELDRDRLLRLLQHLDEESRAAAMETLAAFSGSKKEEIEQVLADEYVSLAEFAIDEAEILTSVKPVGSDPTAARLATENRSLSPRTQVVMWLLLQSANDIFEMDLCPTTLKADNIRLNRSTLRPKLVDLTLERKTPAGVQKCMSSLADIFQEQLINQGEGNLFPLPLEIKHLLTIMRTQALALLPLIIYHPALLPMENRCEYFDRMFGYIKHVLKFVDPGAYHFVLQNVRFPKDWDSRLRTNTILRAFYDEAPDQYQPRGTSADEEIAKEEAAWEALRFSRNLPAHAMKWAADPPSPGGMLFNKTGMGQMLYTVLDGILCSVALCLQRVNHFTKLDLQSLFPGKVVVSKPKAP